jgi:hypothetical protein
MTVDLMALITPANSTAQVFASSDFYNRDWRGYGPPHVVPFFLGPQGSADANSVMAYAYDYGARRPRRCGGARHSAKPPGTAITARAAAPLKTVTGSLRSPVNGIACSVKSLAPQRISTNVD